MFLNRKIGLFYKRNPNHFHNFRIWVDPIQSRYAKAAEATEVVANNVISKRFGSTGAIEYVSERDSKETAAIQLCDLLLGATMDAWRGNAQSPHKLDLQKWIAHHMGWSDLRADTNPTEQKFNTWYWVPKGVPREVATRQTKFVYPVDSRK